MQCLYKKSCAYVFRAQDFLTIHTTDQMEKLVPRTDGARPEDYSILLLRRHFGKGISCCRIGSKRCSQTYRHVPFFLQIIIYRHDNTSFLRSKAAAKQHKINPYSSIATRVFFEQVLIYIYFTHGTAYISRQFYVLSPAAIYIFAFFI